MTGDPDGAAAAELARQLVVTFAGDDHAAWLSAAVTAIGDDPAFGRLVLLALCATAATSLTALDCWSPGTRRQVLRLEPDRPA